MTTHWAVAERLAAAYPDVRVEHEALHIRDGAVRTAAGVTAGLDLALALVEEDLGREVAKRVAAQLVMFFKRPGGQMQFSRNGLAELSGRSALQELQRWVLAHPEADLAIPALADRMALSSRHFARLFRSEVGTTPAAWVEQVRVNAARGLLEAAKVPPKQIAGLLGITPAEYRRRNHGPMP